MHSAPCCISDFVKAALCEPDSDRKRQTRSRRIQRLQVLADVARFDLFRSDCRTRNAGRTQGCGWRVDHRGPLCRVCHVFAGILEGRMSCDEMRDAGRAVSSELSNYAQPDVPVLIISVCAATANVAVTGKYVPSAAH